MLIDTAVIGSVEVSRDKIIHIPDGLLGFEEKRDYALIEKQDDDVTLTWLQSIDSQMPCFVVFDPFEIIDGFEPVLEGSDLKFFDCKDLSELQFYVIAVVPDNIQDITVNLKSPVVVRKSDGRAKQIVLLNSDYPIRFAMFPDEN